jgi:hypothetical protein
LLHIDDLLTLLDNPDLTRFLTQGEHPSLGCAWLHVHPCHTQNVLWELAHARNPLLAWLSVLAQVLRISLPLSFFN